MTPQDTMHIASLAQSASDQLGIEWALERGMAIGRLGGKSVAEVSTYRVDVVIEMCVDRSPLVLHVAALHGVALLHAAGQGT